MLLITIEGLSCLLEPFNSLNKIQSAASISLFKSTIMDKNLETTLLLCTCGSLNTLKTKIRTRCKVQVACPSPHPHTMLKTHSCNFSRSSILHQVGEGTHVTDFENIALSLGVSVKSLIITGFA